jgi:hypothetical protein
MGLAGRRLAWGRPLARARPRPGPGPVVPRLTQGPKPSRCIAAAGGGAHSTGAAPRRLCWGFQTVAAPFGTRAASTDDIRPRTGGVGGAGVQRLRRGRCRVGARTSAHHQGGRGAHHIGAISDDPWKEQLAAKKGEATATGARGPGSIKEQSVQGTTRTLPQRRAALSRHPAAPEIPPPAAAQVGRGRVMAPWSRKGAGTQGERPSNPKAHRSPAAPGIMAARRPRRGAAAVAR